MERVIVLADQRVVAIGRQQVLHKVISAEGKEVNFVGKSRDKPHGCRNFDHDADRNIVGKINTFFRQIAAGFLDHFKACNRFIHTRNHREEQFDLAVAPCHENRFNLSLENVPVVEGDTNRAPAHEGVVLLGWAEVRETFVSPDIQSPDGDRLAGKGLDHAAVELVLILSAGKIAAGHIGKFCTIETDPLGTEALGNINVADQADVCTKGNAVAVSSHCRFVAILFKAAELAGLVNLKPMILVLDRLKGVDVDPAGIAINDQAVFGGNVLESTTHGNNGWNPH